MAIVATFLSGLIFGLGLVVSGLINPAKVLNFLDVTGTWDPSLAITMAAAVAVTGLGYRLAFAKGRPILSEAFQLPAASAIDARLLAGAALFGIGWGLVGYCPGPAIAGLSLGVSSTVVFVASMLAGMAIARLLTASAPTTRASRQPAKS
jgi:uncharacterized membrane protein YedE/YeeE